VQFVSVVEASAAVAAAAGRLRKIEILADAIRAAGPDDAAIAVAYLAGDLPQGRLGLGWATLRDAHVEEAPPTPSLALRDVDAACDRLAKARGRGAHALRARILRELLARMTVAERDFFFRLALGELRQGALQGVVTEAVARAAGVDAGAVRRAAMLAGALPPVAAALMRDGPAALAAFRLRLFQPVQPMLAQPAIGLGEALDGIANAALEWKLDGARIQAHKDGDVVRVFTRQLNDVTDAVPEVVETVRALPARSLVLDGEAIALHPDGRPRPFQETMRRFGRRLEVDELRAELPLSCFFFDLLHADGADLLDQPLAARRQPLLALLPEANRVPTLLTTDRDAADAFVRQALDAGHEGVLIKDLAAPYEAGRRGAAWRKLKPVQTLDLVVLAAEWGSGRRHGFLSNIHLGARDPATGGFVMVGKTFKGMTDAMLAEQTRAFLDRQTHTEGQVVFVRPELVVEIAFDGVQTSPRYEGGVVLRFARVVRYRPDKGPAEADTIDTVRAKLGAQEAAAEDAIAEEEEEREGEV